MKIKNIFLIATLLIYMACSDDNVDTEPPEIEIVKPIEYDSVIKGDTLFVEANVWDNEYLNSWKIDIHDNFDGHTHKNGSLKNSDQNIDEAENDELIAWNLILEDSFPKDKSKYQIKKQIKVPENAEEGEYHLGVFASDKWGNVNQVFISFYIISKSDD
ncbi:DUF4625 domain-containing protein [Marinilabiliaceae bacterium ANBcel2]|nr:DUF4625 domain-containing protein [Marinilabiliaceae bacterium ANBcel2]